MGENKYKNNRERRIGENKHKNQKERKLLVLIFMVEVLRIYISSKNDPPN